MTLQRIDKGKGPADVLDTVQSLGLCTCPQIMEDTGRPEPGVRRCLGILTAAGFVRVHSTERYRVQYACTHKGRQALWALEHGIKTHHLRYVVGMLGMLADYGPLPTSDALVTKGAQIGSLTASSWIRIEQVGDRQYLHLTDTGKALIEKWRADAI